MLFGGRQTQYSALAVDDGRSEASCTYLEGSAGLAGA